MRLVTAVRDQDFRKHGYSPIQLGWRFWFRPLAEANLTFAALMLASTESGNPVGIALFEEGGDAFAGFRRGAQVGDTAGGFLDQRVVDRLAVDRADQILGCGLGKRAAL